MSNSIKIGVLLSSKDRKHLGFLSQDDIYQHGIYQFIRIDEDRPITEQDNFDIILHKVSDYIKREKIGDKIASRIIKELTGIDKDKVVLIDAPDIVLDLADRSKMFALMDECRLTFDGITVDVPAWLTLVTASDIDHLISLNFKFPLICKALCAGDGPGGHSMQIVFNPDQLKNLKVFPCVAQEFKNHNGLMTKIFVYGPDFFITTRPSVRNFPTNGQPNILADTICFNSHDVAKLNAKTFLNNYQNGFALKNSANGDDILNEEVVKKILSKLACHIEYCLIGIDVLVTDNGNTYNLVDVNYLPSYDGVDHKFERLLKIIYDFSQNKKFVNYWEDKLDFCT